VNGDRIFSETALPALKKLSAILLFLGTASLVGFILPTTNSYLRPFNTILSLLFGILSWNLYYLIIPTQYFYRPKWMKLRIVCIPFIWIVLVAVLNVFLSQIPPDQDRLFQDMLL